MKTQDGFQYSDLTNSLISNKNISIVASKWNDGIVTKMVNESLKHLGSLNVTNVEVLRVPGAPGTLNTSTLVTFKLPKCFKDSLTIFVTIPSFHLLATIEIFLLLINEFVKSLY